MTMEKNASTFIYPFLSSLKALFTMLNHTGDYAQPELFTLRRYVRIGVRANGRHANDSPDAGGERDPMDR